MSYDFNDHVDEAMKRPMMKNEKCPVCNCPMVEFYLGWKCPTDNCGFRCSKNSLPRIAAAMELARARSAYAQAPSSLGDEETQELWDDVTTTTKRVLEVFGGE